MQKFLNLTKHPIKLNDGTVFSPSGILARLDTDIAILKTIGNTKIFETEYKQPIFTDEDGKEVNVSKDDIIIVSGMMIKPLRKMGYDAVGPATAHPETKRNDKGFVESVPGLTI